MLSVLSRIWTRVAVSISNDDNHFTTGTAQYIYIYIYIYIYNRRKLNRWSSASPKCTYPSRIPAAALPGNKQQEPLASTWTKKKTKRVHVFWTRRSHLHLKWRASDISRQVHVPWQQCLIYWNQACTAIDRLSIKLTSNLSD